MSIESTSGSMAATRSAMYSRNAARSSGTKRSGMPNASATARDSST